MKFKKIIKNALIGALVISIFALIDMLSKKYFFCLPKEGVNFTGETTWEWKGVLAFRSFGNSNSTVLSLFHFESNNLVQEIIGLVLISILSILLILSKNKFTTISLAIIISGVWGNTFDRILNGYVKDFIFTPWWDKGTFNIADILIVFGSGLLFISLLSEVFKSIPKNKSMSKKI